MTIPGYNDDEGEKVKEDEECRKIPSPETCHILEAPVLDLGGNTQPSTEIYLSCLHRFLDPFLLPNFSQPLSYYHPEPFVHYSLSQRTCVHH